MSEDVYVEVSMPSRQGTAANLSSAYLFLFFLGRYHPYKVG